MLCCSFKDLTPILKEYQLFSRCLKMQINGVQVQRQFLYRLQILCLSHRGLQHCSPFLLLTMFKMHKDLNRYWKYLFGVYCQCKLKKKYKFIPFLDIERVILPLPQTVFWIDAIVSNSHRSDKKTKLYLRWIFLHYTIRLGF